MKSSGAFKNSSPSFFTSEAFRSRASRQFERPEEPTGLCPEHAILQHPAQDSYKFIYIIYIVYHLYINSIQFLTEPTFRCHSRLVALPRSSRPLLLRLHRALQRLLQCFLGPRKGTVRQSAFISSVRQLAMKSHSRQSRKPLGQQPQSGRVGLVAVRFAQPTPRMSSAKPGQPLGLSGALRGSRLPSRG